jgi:hypothetical protein
MSAENERAAVQQASGRSYGEMVRETFAAVDREPRLFTRTMTGQPDGDEVYSPVLGLPRRPYQNTYKPQRKAKRKLAK